MNYSDYDKKHLSNQVAYMRHTARLFDQMVDRIRVLYEKIPQDVPFDINNFPGLKKGIDLELRRLAKEMQQGIVNGIGAEWSLSNNKNDLVVDSIVKGRRIPSELEGKWKSRNMAGLEAFRNRKDGGLKISDRVWKVVKGQRDQIEREMAYGIYKGTPATELAESMKRHLRNPDEFITEIRTVQNDLKLTTTGKKLSPGRGVYKSPYKNALRLTRTETNRAYQKADNERWNQQDFVLGVEVQRSNVPYDCDICDAGVGHYPKEYQWDALHPNCRCRAIPILADEDQIQRSIDAAFDDRDYEFKGYVEKVPESFETLQKETNYTHYGH